MLNAMVEIIIAILEPVIIIVDVIGYAILIFTVVKFTFRYIAFEFQRLRGYQCAKLFQDIRVEFLSHVIMAIDFMVVSDVIHSGLVQTRDSLITLGIFVLIRSILAFFLGLDLKDIQKEKIEE